MDAAMLTETLRDRGAGPGEFLFPIDGTSIGRARLIVVVPPFASPDRPSIGAHIVAQVGGAAGFASEVLYANLSFARLIGIHDYARLCHTSTGHLIGERIFSPAVYGSAASDELEPDALGVFEAAVRRKDLSFRGICDLAADWADLYAEQLAALPAEIIGFTSTFEQTLASLGLISRVKRLAPAKRMILGGANVDGSMAEAVAALSPAIDHVFAGESEASFAAFLSEIERGGRPDRIIRGRPNWKLDDLPAPEYASYQAQLDATVAAGQVDGGIRPQDMWLPYESSRGCWWGAKHHCTFCGLNALGMSYREKKAEKVLTETAALANRHPGARIMMVDNIMPHSYFTTLVPALAKRDEPLSIFYEQKANLSFARMQALAEAGIRRIQPGIESLDTSILKLMRKGSTLRTNLECLRFALSLKIDVTWNLIVDFPGEEDAAYERMLALIPNIFHLQPPSGVSPLSIERFSPYFDEPGAFGIRKIVPIPAYGQAHPGLSDPSSIAYHFVGDYESACRRRPELLAKLQALVDAWEQAWKEGETVPLLEVFDIGEDRFLICDSRPSARSEVEFLSPAEARMCLTGEGGEELARWAVERRYAWAADGRILPLAVASPECLGGLLGS
jgi:ribosomal peptide maturation radical SAM protein 1